MWVIFNPTEGLYWSNSEGWCGLAIATRFTTAQKKSIPYIPSVGSIWKQLSKGGEA
jgi:hypothetical protein